MCAGKHSEDKCPNKNLNRAMQLNNVRKNFEKATRFQQQGKDYYNGNYERDYGYYKNDRNDRNSNRSYQDSNRYRDKYYDNNKRYDKYDNK